MRVGFTNKAREPWASRLMRIATACCLVLASRQAAGQALDVRYGVVDPPVVAQRDITVGLLTSIHPQDPEPKPLECSGVTWAGDRLVMTSDRHSHILLTSLVDLDAEDLVIEMPKAQVVVDNERLLMLDAEAVTARPTHSGGHEVLVMCSLSNDQEGSHRAKRAHLTRVSLDSSGSVIKREVKVLSGIPIREALDAHFEALRVKRYSSYNVARNKNTPRWGNVEGLAWSPDNRTLLCGMRNPLANEDALIFALQGVDKAFDAGDANLLGVTDLFRLDLGGRGVTDMSWDPVTHGYLITAALSNGPKLEQDQTYPLADLDAVLYWWSGHKEDAPSLIARFSDLNVDGVCRVGSTPYIVLISDEGDVSEERQGRQSVLTLMYFMGQDQAAKP